MRCRGCDSLNLKALWNCSSYNPCILKSLHIDESLPSGTLYQCQKCGLVQRFPCLNELDLKRIYELIPSNIMTYRFETNAAWVEAKKQIISLFSDAVNLNVLDVGCHTGEFLSNLPMQYQRFGTEGGLLTKEIAKSRDVKIIGDFLDDIESRWFGYFDVVTLFDVFEHLLTPTSALLKAAQLVKPNGVLIISTSSLDAWTWNWFRGSHWYLQTPLHVSLASKKFFQYFENNSSMKLLNSYFIPHTFGNFNEISRDYLEAIYFGARQRDGAWKIVAKSMLKLPKFSYLRHRSNISWMFRIPDHSVVVFRG